MTDTEIRTMLDQLAEYRAQRDVTMLRKQSAIDAVMTDEIRAQLSDIEAEYGIMTEAVEQNIVALEAEIKRAVIAHGSTVKGAHVQAVYAKGRVTWDAKALDGYATAHTELFAFRSEGEPSVSIRTVKG